MNRVCASLTCEKQFEAKTVSNIYCSSICRSETTNNRLKQQYHTKRARLNGKLVRTCNHCLITRLSRYNKEDVCEPCIAQREEDARDVLLAELGAL